MQNSITNVCGDVIEAPNGNLILIGLSYKTVNGHSANQLTFVGTDALGNELWRKDYGSWKFEYLDGINKNSVVQDNNSFYLTLVARDSSSKQQGVLLKVDYTGDTLWQKIFRDNNGEVWTDGITKSVDGGLLLSGSYQNPISILPALVLKTDINGNELWRKVIHKPAPNEQIMISLKQDAFSKKIIMVGLQFSGAQSKRFINVLILDSLGNKLVQTTFNNAGGGASSDVIQLSDKNFLSTGSWLHSDSSGTPYFQALMVKFDTNGTIIWQKKFNEPSFYNDMYYLHELANQDIVSVGRSEISGIVKPQIFKFDKYGNLKWKRTVGNADGPYRNVPEASRSMNPTKDGGFIIATVFWGMLNPQPYSIIKIDSTACDTTEAWCTSVILGINDHNKITGYNFELFPNPASTSVSFKINAPVDKKFNLKIIDVSGKELELAELNPNENLELNISRYQPGIYFVELLCDERIIETKKLIVVR